MAGYTAAEALSFQLGQGDFDRLTGTSTHATDLNSQNTDGTPAGYLYYKGFARWNRIKALTACTFTSMVVEGGDALAAADVLPISQELEGRFTEITLTSGVLIAYRG